MMKHSARADAKADGLKLAGGGCLKHCSVQGTFFPFATRLLRRIGSQRRDTKANVFQIERIDSDRYCMDVE